MQITMDSLFNRMIKISSNVRDAALRADISCRNTSCVSRKRTNDIFDAVAYKLYYSNTNTTQEEVGGLAL